MRAVMPSPVPDTREPQPDWLAWSASALVTGPLLLMLGALLNPTPTGASPVESLGVAADEGGRWLGMAAAYFLASITWTAGIPVLATAVSDRGSRRSRSAPRGIRGRIVGGVGILLLTIGALGTTGFAALLVFFRALAEDAAVRPGALESVTNDTGFALFLTVWIVSFYGGVLLVGLALLVSRSVPAWVAVLMFAFVAAFPLAQLGGQVGQMVQLLTLTAAFTGVAMHTTGVHTPV